MTKCLKIYIEVALPWLKCIRLRMYLTDQRIGELLLSWKIAFEFDMIMKVPAK